MARLRDQLQRGTLPAGVRSDRRHLSSVSQQTHPSHRRHCIAPVRKHYTGMDASYYRALPHKWMRDVLMAAPFEQRAILTMIGEQKRLAEMKVHRGAFRRIPTDCAQLVRILHQRCVLKVTYRVHRLPSPLTLIRITHRHRRSLKAHYTPGEVGIHCLLPSSLPLSLYLWDSRRPP
jgi:hypothetical protein